jgi:hypothetical protein
MASSLQQPFPAAPSPLGRIVLTLGVVGVLGAGAWALADDAAGPRFVQAGIAVGAIVYLATFVDILLGLSFLILCIGFSPEVSFAGLDQLRLEDFIVPALLLGWIARAAKERERFGPLRIGGVATAYFAVMVLSTLIGLAAGTTPPVRALTTLAKYVEYFILYLIVLHNVRTGPEFRALVLVALGTAAASSLLSATGYLGVTDGSRSHGPTSETANIYGGYLVLHLAIAVGLVLHSSTGLGRMAALATAAVITYCVGHTYSRTSYSALGAALLAFGILRERRLLPVLAIGVLLAPLFVSGNVLSRVSTIGGVAVGEGPSSWQSRVYAWQWTLERMSGFDYFFGSGIGSVVLGDIDNEYVRALADTGIAGLICFLVLLARYMMEVDRAYRAIPSQGFHKGAAAGFWIAAAALAVHGIGATSFTSIRTMEAFVVLAGLAMAQANRIRDWGGAAPEDLGPRPVAPPWMKALPPGPPPLVLIPSPPARR